MPRRYETDYRVGQDNLRKFGMDIHHPVFWVSALLVLVFVISSIVFPHLSKEFFSSMRVWITTYFDWLFMLAGNIFVVFCLALIFSPLGKIRIGGKDARPGFSRLSWFSMLFAAGMGIGLMFWSVAEPVAYFTDWFGTPLGVAPETKAAKMLALGATMYHWGLHPWSIYAVVALTLAFFTFNKKLPLSLRSGFFSLIHDRSWGVIGHVIDTVAVLATIFGLATSLGFGAQQAAAGFHYLFDIPNSTATQLLIIFGVTGVATYSVVRGLDGGVKLLSNINIAMAFVFIILIMAVGPTGHIFSSIWLTAKSYLANIVELSRWSDRSDEKFMHGWTTFYWAWWISWSPFVGIFIARVSKGRTVREFLTAVLLIPTVVTCVWMGTFGGIAINQVMKGSGELAGGISQVELALFQMLEPLPLTGVLSFLAIVIVLCFFVTSSDSGSLVIDSITAGGKLEAPVPQRIFWAVAEGLIAAGLLIGGGKDALGALQAAVISVGLPFTFVLLAMLASLLLGLWHEKKFVGG